MTSYRYMADELDKIAAKKKWSPLGAGVKMLGATALGAGLGTAAGYGAGALADAASRKYTGKAIPLEYVAPAGAFLGGMSGLMLALARKKNLEDVRRVIKDQ